MIDAISAALTPEGLLALNTRSVDGQASASTIAGDWLAENPITIALSDLSTEEMPAR
ncbi:hypothetical protein [Rathayibacter oskolensis]|uniref:hypothetical protein n=1 Tax=Rathayibacter oskolensis TaxID=1891671 RepID=UPI0013FD2BFF|nr:hypothetical protein [Rathayibacter oskolensis]